MKRRTILTAAMNAAAIPALGQEAQGAQDGERPASFSSGISIQTGGEVINVTSQSDPLNVERALLYVVNDDAISCTFRARANWVGTEAAPYQNHDVALFETFNRIEEDSLNRSWAGSFCNAYNAIPEGVTDRGTRVGVLGWATSVANPYEDYRHEGELAQQIGVQGTAGFQGSGSGSSAVINEAVGVRGNVLNDSKGATIRNAIAGQFSCKAEAGDIARSVAVQATAASGEKGNYSFYGVSGTLFNAGQVVVGLEASQSDARVAARTRGNAVEFGHPDPSGFGSNLGSTVYSGMPFLAFSAEASEDGDTFTTRGKKGTVISGDNTGSMIFSRVENADAADQGPIENARFTEKGNLRLQANPILKSQTPASSTAPGEPGEMSWDESYVYVCIAPNLWRRSELMKF